MPIDLDAQRAERAKTRAAARPVDPGEANADTQPIILGGRVVAELPAELPLAALAPLQEVQDDAMLLIRQAVTVIGIGEQEPGRVDAATAGLVVDVLAANPKLPASLIAVVQDIGRQLLGDDGYAAVVAAIDSAGPDRFSVLDAAELIKGVVAWYAAAFGSLGKSSKPSGSAKTGGTTSNGTSRRTSVSTPAGSGRGRTTRGL